MSIPFFKSSILLETEGSLNSTYAVANCILDYCGEITSLKLQKLIFFSYGIHLSIYQERLFGCDLLAWNLGPVVREIYDEFKDHGRNEITTRATNSTQEENEYDFFVPNIPSEFKKDKLSVIAACLYYGNRYDSPQLENITHGMKSWKNAFNVIDKKMKDEEILNDFNILKSEIIKFVNAC